MSNTISKGFYWSCRRRDRYSFGYSINNTAMLILEMRPMIT